MEIVQFVMMELQALASGNTMAGEAFAYSPYELGLSVSPHGWCNQGSLAFQE